jgi:DNA-binding IclR family transcriptional regulator
VHSRIEQLILDCIDSVEQCEMLVTMCNVHERWWTAADLARELYLPPSRTGRDLELLATRGLLEVRIANDMLYRIAPASPELSRATTELADLYRSNRAEILSYIVRAKGRALRHFAEAFNFRRDRR